MQADEELLKLKAEDLPGVGWAMREKLKALGITTVVDVRNSRVAMLQHELGTKSGTLVRSNNTTLREHVTLCSYQLKLWREIGKGYKINIGMWGAGLGLCSRPG